MRGSERGASAGFRRWRGSASGRAPTRVLAALALTVLALAVLGGSLLVRLAGERSAGPSPPLSVPAQGDPPQPEAVVEPETIGLPARVHAAPGSGGQASPRSGPDVVGDAEESLSARDLGELEDLYEELCRSAAEEQERAFYARATEIALRMAELVRELGPEGASFVAQRVAGDPAQPGGNATERVREALLFVACASVPGRALALEAFRRDGPTGPRLGALLGLATQASRGKGRYRAWDYFVAHRPTPLYLLDVPLGRTRVGNELAHELLDLSRGSADLALRELARAVAVTNAAWRDEVLEACRRSLEDPSDDMARVSLFVLAAHGGPALTPELLALARDAPSPLDAEILAMLLRLRPDRDVLGEVLRASADDAGASFSRMSLLFDLAALLRGDDWNEEWTPEVTATMIHIAATSSDEEARQIALATLARSAGEDALFLLREALAGEADTDTWRNAAWLVPEVDRGAEGRDLLRSAYLRAGTVEGKLAVVNAARGLDPPLARELLETILAAEEGTPVGDLARRLLSELDS